ncbi:Hypothetical predicted protein [Octopus vulgaris]|uniref:Uncharacterized protein n=2 Tax=Octopus vulgaris TaxID=6645 RepID=A0AA36HJF7_OCTVU|nr:Hypothetical predicted protein [Octopus vulgaris]
MNKKLFICLFLMISRAAAAVSGMMDAHLNPNITNGSQSEMGTIKEPGSNAAVTSSLNYAMAVLCILIALKHLFN